MAESSNPELRPICKEDIDNESEVSTIGQKGENGINVACIQRDDRIVYVAGVQVYTDCRKRCTNTQQFERNLSANPPISPAKKRTRGAKGLFNNKTDCSFCGVTIQSETSDYSNVKIHTFADSILKCCGNRSNNCVTTVTFFVSLEGSYNTVRAHHDLFVYFYYRNGGIYNLLHENLRRNIQFSL